MCLLLHAKLPGPVWAMDTMQSAPSFGDRRMIPPLGLDADIRKEWECPTIYCRTDCAFSGEALLADIDRHEDRSDGPDQVQYRWSRPMRYTGSC